MWVFLKVGNDKSGCGRVQKECRQRETVKSAGLSPARNCACCNDPQISLVSFVSNGLVRSFFPPEKAGWFLLASHWQSFCLCFCSETWHEELLLLIKPFGASKQKSVSFIRKAVRNVCFSFWQKKQNKTKTKTKTNKQKKKTSKTMETEKSVCSLRMPLASLKIAEKRKQPEAYLPLFGFYMLSQYAMNIFSSFLCCGSWTSDFLLKFCCVLKCHEPGDNCIPVTLSHPNISVEE